MFDEIAGEKKMCKKYMYKEDLALNNLQWLICHKT